LGKFENLYMTNIEIREKASLLIAEKFEVASDYADRLAVAALNGIDSHGGNPVDWETIVKTVDVVVKSWIEQGAFKSEAS
jgi:hypothetical protein